MPANSSEPRPNSSEPRRRRILNGVAPAACRRRGARLARGLLRFIAGDEAEGALVPLLVVSLLSTTAFAALWSYVGIWSVTRLHASPGEVGVVYAINALAAASAGYFGGRLSDRLGRRFMICLGWGGEAAAALALTAVGNRSYLGFALIVVAGAASGPGFAATNAVVADLIPSGRQESAYATLRVISNIGYAAGPPLAALAIVGGHWAHLFIGAGVLGMASAVVAATFLGAPAAAPAPKDSGPAARKAHDILRNAPFLLLLLSTLLAFIVYVAYENVLPIAAVSYLKLHPTTWGLLAVINPVVVTLGQIRVTRAVQRISPTQRLAGALLLMGTPFLLLILNASVAMIAVVIFVFAVGEMIWVPTSQVLAARLAPPDARGAYMGAFGASGSVAWAIGPLIALNLLGAHGPAETWIFFASASVLAGAAGAASVLTAIRRGRWQQPDGQDRPASEEIPSGDTVRSG
jgi:predicted MFS family arabinose efflux permease